MSERSFFDDLEQTGQPEVQDTGPRRRGRRRPLRGCLPVLVVLAVLAGGGWYAYNFVADQIREWTSGAEDYDGTTMGEEVVFEVSEGQSISAMGEELVELDVVASHEAFMEAALSRPDEETRGIQVGAYLLRERMPAVDAVAILVDPANLVQSTVTVPEGLRVVDVVDLLAEETEFNRRQFNRVLQRPDRLGLPDYADGNAEGYLFPATYVVTPADTPRSILTAMVERWEQAASDVGLEAGASALGYTPQEIMTIASLIEAEAPPPYMAQVARVIYNRIEQPDNGTSGLLQLDATVNYAHGNNLGARTTSEQRQIDSPYNTYRYPGLPPGPIEAPGEDAMRAAVEPAEGDWLYYVTVNLRTGETKFAETLTEHNANVAELNEYCRTESERC